MPESTGDLASIVKYLISDPETAVLLKNLAERVSKVAESRGLDPLTLTAIIYETRAIETGVQIQQRIQARYSEELTRQIQASLGIVIPPAQ